MNIYNRIIVVLIATIIFANCKKDDTTNNNSNLNLTAIDEYDIAYGTDIAQKMDIYLPANRTDTGTKVLVMIHGGAWIAGDKTDFASYITKLKISLPDYAIINLNYRLAVPPSTNLWPTQFSDINVAFDFIKNKSSEYHYNGNKIAVMGASAGAQLALLKAYKNNTDNAIKTVVDYFGPTEMTDLYYFQASINQSLFAMFMNGTPTTNSSSYIAASPLYFVNSTSPATIMFHGTADVVVPYQQSVQLDSALNANGRIHLYKQYAGEPHAVFSTANDTDAYNNFVAFVKANNN